MRNTLRLFLPLLLLALLVAACGNTGDNVGNQDNNNLGVDEPGVGEPLTGTQGLENDDTAVEEGADAADETLTGALEVDIDNMTFDKQDLSINVGDTVTWTNNDDVPHTVTAGTPDMPSEEFDSGELQPGDTFSYTFDEAGTFDYFCSIHPDMTATIIVEAE